MLNLLTAIFYSAGTSLQVLSLKNKQDQRLFGQTLGFLAISCGCLAALLHGYLLYSLIDLSSGQNLTEINLLSLASWLIVMIIIPLAAVQPVAYLQILIFPFAAASIFLAIHSHARYILQTGNHPSQFLHILLSVFTFSVLSIAAIQALTLALQEKLLKLKHLEAINILPPLETMEKILFQLLFVGVILLSGLIGTSLYFFHSILLNHFLQKTIITLVAWLIFTFLLLGRQYFGWRGKKAVYCTLGGVFLLSILYYGGLLMTRLQP